MPGTFTCCHCGTIVPRNLRLKKSQKYCNKTHRKKRLESQKACYAKRPGHAYQAAYREKHPEYDQRNRELQRKRNKSRPKDGSSMIVNTDALSLQSSIDGAYALMPITSGGKSVNTDAFVVQLHAMTGLQGYLPSNTV